ncbi:hypothetical protein [Erysipelothrix aquatica]|uniref:hypothetical protein n=1 Tax=Erysipelothrix aquatica TaxID=2683714 RepID=UPI00135CAD2F|nr:hypothetical protein [Erysipelothrix aquatica]
MKFNKIYFLGSFIILIVWAILFSNSVVDPIVHLKAIHLDEPSLFLAGLSWYNPVVFGLYFINLFCLYKSTIVDSVGISEYKVMELPRYQSVTKYKRVKLIQTTRIMCEFITLYLLILAILVFAVYRKINIEDIIYLITIGTKLLSLGVLFTCVFIALDDFYTLDLTSILTSMLLLLLAIDIFGHATLIVGSSNVSNLIFGTVYLVISIIIVCIDYLKNQKVRELH